MKIGILDYKYCSVLPIYYSFKSFEPNTQIITEPSKISLMDKIVLPGVGATNKIMEFLNNYNFVDKILKFKNDNKPILGICAGMQIMSKHVYENEKKNGLNFFNSEVVSLDNNVSDKITNIGWVDTSTKEKKNSYYYCHSFYMKFQNINDESIVGTIKLKKKIPTMIKSKNIIGVQFHPEKSQTKGREFISNFLNGTL